MPQTKNNRTNSLLHKNYSQLMQQRHCHQVENFNAKIKINTRIIMPMLFITSLYNNPCDKIFELYIENVEIHQVKYDMNKQNLIIIPFVICIVTSQKIVTGIIPSIIRFCDPKVCQEGKNQHHDYNTIASCSFYHYFYNLIEQLTIRFLIWLL